MKTQPENPEKLAFRVLPLEPLFIKEIIIHESSSLPLPLHTAEAAWQKMAEALGALQQVAAALGQAGGTVPPPLASPPSPLSPPHPPQNFFSTREGKAEGGPGGELTLFDLVHDVLLAKARRGLSEAYLRRLRVTLGAFVQGRGRKHLAQITTAEIEGYLDRQEWQPRTKRGVLDDLKMLFAIAQKRGYLADNPAAPLEPPQGANHAPGIHTPDQVKNVLALAYAQDMALGKLIALRYFAGLRTAESLRLAQEDILQDRDYIEIKASKAKTRRRRLVKIQPALAAWLALGGVLPLRNPNTRLATLTHTLSAQGIPWSANVTRHSFVSYHLAHFGNAGRTALEAGHTEQMIFQHYRALVTDTDAKAFWQIRPE